MFRIPFPRRQDPGFRRLPAVKYLRPRLGPELLVWAAVLVFVAALAGTLARAFGSVLDATLARSFAATVLGFETSVVAIAIPTALNIVGRIYEKYASNRMRDVLLQGLPLIRLALVSFSSIVVLLLVISGVIHTGAFLEWMLLFGVLTTAVLFFLFLDTVVHFVVNEPFAAIELMGQKLRRELARGVPDYAGDGEYVTAVQGIGDILAYASGQGTQDDTVDQCLAALDEPVSFLLRLRERDRDAYLSAVVRDDLLAEGPARVASSMEFFPEATLAGFMLPVEQAVRGFRLACEGGNDEAGRKAVAWLADLLARLSSEEGRDAEVLAVLRQFRGMTDYAIANGRAALQASAAYGWYFRVLFPGERSGDRPRDSYLRAMGEAAFPCLRRVVREAPQEVFGSYCAHAADWAFESDVSASGTARRAALDELSFAVAAYAYAAGRPDYVLELLDYGRRAVATDADFGRETLPSSPERLLASWTETWSCPGRLERFDGLTASSAAKRRLLALLLARTAYRTGTLPGDATGLSGDERALLVLACRELAAEAGSALVVVGADREAARRALESVAGVLEQEPAGTGTDASPPSRDRTGMTTRFLRVLGLGEADRP